MVREKFRQLKTQIMWIEAPITQLKMNTMAEFNLAGLALFLACVDGQLFCADNRCPHEEVKLTLGCLKNGRIKCSLHGFSFDLTTGKSDEKTVGKLNTYAVKIDAGKIFINLTTLKN